MRGTLSRRGLLLGAAAGLAGSQVAAAAASAATCDPAVTAQLVDLERSYDGRIGAYAVDTSTGTTIAYRAYERFPLLSTFKVLAAGAILRTARRHEPGLLGRVIHWTAADLLANSPVTEQYVDTGLTVAQLCEAAITRSDNTAGNLLLSLLGGPPVITRFARTLGDGVTRLDRWETDLNIWNPAEPRDTTTPAAMAHDLRTLTLGSALKVDGQQRLIGWLRGTATGYARIRAGLPSNWTVGDKTGSSATYGAANDLAIAWPPSTPPLVLAVYTNRNQPDAATDNAVIAAAATILARGLGAL